MTRLWAKVTKAIKEKDLDAATDAKTAIEDAQREMVREREERNEPWKPKYFTLRDGEWRVNLTCVATHLHAVAVLTLGNSLPEKTEDQIEAVRQVSTIYTFTVGSI